MNINEVLERLDGVKKNGRGYQARCPAHDDQHASLSISQGEDGKILVKCFAGCSATAVVSALDLQIGDLFPPTNGEPKRRIVATYDYVDEGGELLSQVVRRQPKDFRQRQPDGKGGWKWSVKGVRAVPYRLDKIVAGDSNTWVYVVEGEKDVHTLEGAGLLATCNAGGAGKWTANHGEFLRGRKVAVLSDNDDAGRKHAKNVATSLQDIAASVKVIELQGLPEKGDVSDWFAAGGTADQLAELVNVTREWTPPTDKAVGGGPVIKRMSDITPRQVQWLWPGRIPLGRLTLLVGRPGEGKSFATVDIASRITTGTPWPDGEQCERGSVLLLTAEDDPADTIRPRLDWHHADCRRVHLLTGVRVVSEQGERERLISLADVDEIEIALRAIEDCRLVVIDPIGSFIGGQIDAHRDNEVRSVLAPIAALAEKHGAAILTVAHRRKSAAGVADDLALGSRAFTGIARAVWHLSRDPADKNRRLLLPGKNNLARESGGLAFSIAGEPPRVIWERDAVAMTADDGLAAEATAERSRRGPNADALGEATAWLSEALAGGARPAREIYDEWEHGQSGSKRTLERAKKDIGVLAYRPVVPGPWLWRLNESSDSKAANNTKREELGDLGDLEENTAENATSDPHGSKVAKLAQCGDLGVASTNGTAGRERMTL